MDMDFGNNIPLKRELVILNTYLGIEKRRFEHQLSFELNVNEEAKPIAVPPFLLQPVVENAIKHGFKDGVEELTIEITANKEGGYLIILVENNGAPIRNTTFGIGLSNCKERLENAYGNNFEVLLEQHANKVLTKLKIPVQ